MRPNRTFTWSGACEGGLVSGQAVLQWYENGVPSDRYEGEYWNNRAHGKGTLRKADGTVVSGDWVNGCLRERERRYGVGVGADASKCP